MSKIVNLVFEGGGIKGLAYVGAIRELAKQGHLKTVKHMAGASAGAITAAFLSLGYSVDEVEARMPSDFTTFQDGRATRLVHSWGMHSGDEFYKWFAKAVKEKLGNEKATFADLHAKVLTQGDQEADVCFRDVHLMGSNLSTQQGEVFSYYTTPNMPLVDAVRISMGFPVAFDAKIYKKDEYGQFVTTDKGLVEDKNGDMYVDGGLALNFPVKLFDQGYPNSETLGFRVDTPAEIAQLKDGKQAERKVIKKWTQFGSALVTTAMWAQHVPEADNFRTVYINTGKIGTLQFKLTPEEKQFLIDEGRKATELFFRGFNYGIGKQKSIVVDANHRLEKRDRERALSKATNIYYKEGQAVLQLIYEKPANQDWHNWQDKIEKYYSWLLVQYGVNSLQHHRNVTDEKQVITLRVNQTLQAEIARWLQKNPQANRIDELLQTQQDKLILLAQQPEHPRPTWMIDPNIKKEQKDALYQAVINNKIQDAMACLQKGVPVDTRYESGNSLLHMAAQTGAGSIVRLLLEHQKSLLHLTNNFRDTALHKAVEGTQKLDPQAETVRVLLGKGAEVNAKTIQEQTPLMVAAYYGHIEAVKQLCEHGAKIDLQDHEGLSALMLAAERGHAAVVTYLLDKKANPNLSDQRGKTALDHAGGQQKVVELLSPITHQAASAAVPMPM
jgi:NTE family protein